MIKKEIYQQQSTIFEQKTNNIPIYSGASHFGVFFDGTGNNRDADIPKGCETNVVKLSELYDIFPKDDFKNNDFSYHIGVGSTSWTRILGGITGAGANSRIDEAYKAATDHFNKPENIYIKRKVIDVFGFSRGAAQARHFVNLIKHLGIQDKQAKKTGEDMPWPKLKGVEIRFLGLFDTVGSFGIPGNQQDLGYDFHVDPGLVQRCVHFTAEHERRDLFDLTSLKEAASAALPGHFVEKSFPGVHSDVGGGYEYTPERKGGWYKKRDIDGKIVDIPEADKRYDDPKYLIYNNDTNQPDTYYLQNIPEKHHTLSRVTLKAMHEELVNAGIKMRPLERHPRYESTVKIDPEVQTFYEQNKQCTPFKEAIESKYIHDSRYISSTSEGSRDVFYASADPALWKNYIELTYGDKPNDRY